MRRLGTQAWSGVLVAVVLAALSASLVQRGKEIKERFGVGPRLEYLTTRLSDSQQEIIDLRKQLEKLRAEMASYQKLVTRGEALARKLSEELEKTKILTGLMSVKGPGVVVKVEDAPSSAIPPGADTEAFVVHDEDLLRMVNELRAAGAEAISINGQRLIATSEIRCSGPIIRVNNTSIGSPYEIRVIGDPKALKDALIVSGGIVDILKSVGIRVKITELKEVIVPGLPGMPTFKFAKPIGPEEAKEAAETVPREG